MNRQSNTHRWWSQPHPRGKQRRAITLVETLVAGSIMVVVMASVAKLTFWARQLSQESDRQRVAMIELSNQLDRLTRMPLDQARQQLENLEVPQATAIRLPDVSLSGRLDQCDLGARVTLTMQWKESHPNKSVELTGWLVSGSSHSTESVPGTSRQPEEPAS